MGWLPGAGTVYVFHVEIPIYRGGHSRISPCTVTQSLKSATRRDSLRIAEIRDSVLSESLRRLKAHHISDRRSPAPMASSCNLGTLAAVSSATGGSVPPSSLAGSGASPPSAGGHIAVEKSTLKTHRQDLANLIKIWYVYTRAGQSD
eukprot:COSAG02_NODE_373_length_23594_cov_6.892190_1_plen_147_part_00